MCPTSVRTNLSQIRLQRSNLKTGPETECSLRDGVICRPGAQIVGSPRQRAATWMAIPTAGPEQQRDHGARVSSGIGSSNSVDATVALTQPSNTPGAVRPRPRRKPVAHGA